MARAEADAGRSPFATDFARGIMSSQQREIDVVRSMSTPDIPVGGARRVSDTGRGYSFNACSTAVERSW